MFISNIKLYENFGNMNIVFIFLFKKSEKKLSLFC